MKGFHVFYVFFLGLCLVPTILYKTSILWNLFHFTTGLEFAVETLKSFILSMALVDNHLTVETAVHLSRLELEFQVVHCFLKIDVDGISCMYATCGLSQGNIAQLLGWDKKRSVGTGARITEWRVGMSSYSGTCFCLIPVLLCIL